MASELRDLLGVLPALIDPARPVDLVELGQMVGLSPCRAQRLFTNVVGESPKKLQQRTRLELGALLLVTTEARIVDVALASGFASHEGFTRAFRASFGVSPRRWRRERAGTLTPEQARRALTISHCGRLYGRSLTNREEPRMDYEIELRTNEPVPVLYQARTVEIDDVGSVLAEVLPAVFGFVMGQGLAPAGHPVVRYVSMTPGSASIEAGIPLVAAPAEAPSAESGILSGELPGGQAAVTVHTGPYEGLRRAYAALEAWIAESDHEVGGPPWESYLTDPGEVPDPAQWQTEVVWPLA